jgi:BRCT domain type II-containing protein
MSLKNKKVCLTGALTMKRAEAAARIAAAGGKVMSGVSKNTDIVVCGDKSGSKLDEAEALGVEVWDEADLLAALSSAGKSKGSSAKAPPAKKAKVASKKKHSGKKGGSKHEFAGKKFCITGTLGTWKRSVAVSKIINAGGEVVAKPSKNVDFMIVGDDAGGKEDDALALGIECWDEEEFIDRLEGGGSAEESEEDDSEEPPSPPTKSTVSASMWDTFVKSGMFSCISVRANGVDYPLRKDQKEELKKWVKGTWDSAWLVVKSGVPRHFVASDGSANALTLTVK